MPYLGASPRNINTRSVIDHQEYLGSQADTSTNSGYYTFYVNYTPGNVSVVIRGVHMASSDYTATNGTDVRISTSTITLANDDVIEIIGYGIPSSQILERSDVNITGGQAINLTQVGASSYKVGNTEVIDSSRIVDAASVKVAGTEVIDSSGNLISGTLGANVSFANIADDAISGDKIHSGTISSSTLDGIKLKSSGNSITASDGTTAVLSESGGLVTLTEDVQHIVPIVIAKRNPAGAQQSVTNSTFTKVQFNTVEIDTHNFFDTTTNYRFTPTIAGYYHICIQVGLQTVGGTRFITDLYKTSSFYRRITDSGATSNNEASYSASAIVELNGSTDYIEVYVYVVQSNPANPIAIESGSGQTQFNAFLIQRTS